MSHLLVVFGATGKQGGSVVQHVLSDPELSSKYKLRAITRDVESEKAKQLKARNVEVVRGDALDRKSLEGALEGAHTVFAVTAPSLSPSEFDVEYDSARAIADVSVQQGAQYIIFSTLAAVSDISGGKYTKLYPYDAKAKAEQYIRQLPVKSAFYAGGPFMQNFQEQAFLAPTKASDGSWVLSRPFSPKMRFPVIDGVRDTGKFVGAILAEPDKYEGKTLCAAEGFYTLEEICAVISKTSGKRVVYKQVSESEFWAGLTAMVGNDIADIFTVGFKFYEDYGAFGPDSEGQAKWARENARGQLRTLEEFFEAHPLQLE